MHAKITLLLSIVLIATLSCTDSQKNIHEKHQDHKLHWSYSGETSPEHWIEIEKNSDCGGKRQSPINIIHKNAIAVKIQEDLKIQYTPTTLISKVENNGHSIQFDFEAGDSITYKDETYYLKQIHFHEPSEHKINGVIYPIEMHLVHVNKAGKITVLGILGEEGEESQLFEFLESFLPIEEGAEKDIHQKIDLSSLVLEDKHYYSYGGSLTTPPCTENVNWIVFKEPIVLSVQEVLKLKNNMPINNYRNEQPLNDRAVTYHF
ncbi:carbonic anhydrase [Flavivirga eckloniae]|uniref:Carbonic anhydrase n=1 Tax=Flavivirga eckloniae TaxID=1803846 RepID=A0A2K9PX19_9FLAO|nr:carbonic anhydrase family protein [Flavivirga eckloniae]AUP81087.1 carbonate dehydratase [Flavivirga eckloniae]